MESEINNFNQPANEVEPGKKVNIYKIIIIFDLILLIAGLIIGGFLYWKNNNKKVAGTTTNKIVIPTAPVAEEVNKNISAPTQPAVAEAEKPSQYPEWFNWINSLPKDAHEYMEFTYFYRMKVYNNFASSGEEKQKMVNCINHLVALTISKIPKEMRSGDTFIKSKLGTKDPQMDQSFFTIILNYFKAREIEEGGEAAWNMDMKFSSTIPAGILSNVLDSGSYCVGLKDIPQKYINESNPNIEIPVFQSMEEILQNDKN